MNFYHIYYICKYIYFNSNICFSDRALTIFISPLLCKAIVKELLFTGSRQMLNHRDSLALAPLHRSGKGQFLVSSVVWVASTQKHIVLFQGEGKKTCLF